MSNVTTLINAGPDAFTNLYDVVFEFPTKIVGDSENLINTISVRVQDFPFPELALTPYNVSYKAVQLKRFAPKITGSRKLNLNIRLDSGWDIYELFKAWKRLYANENTTDITFRNFVADVNDVENYGKIRVKAYKSSNSLAEVTEATTEEVNSIGAEWKFYNVSCINVEEPQFTRESANIVNLAVSFIFGVYVPAGETDPLI